MLTEGQERALDAIDHSARYVRNAPRGFCVAVRSLVAKGVVRPVRENAYWPADFERVPPQASVRFMSVQAEGDAGMIADVGRMLGAAMGGSGES